MKTKKIIQKMIEVYLMNLDIGKEEDIEEVIVEVEVEKEVREVEEGDIEEEEIEIIINQERKENLIQRKIQ